MDCPACEAQRLERIKRYPKNVAPREGCLCYVCRRLRENAAKMEA